MIDDYFDFAKIRSSNKYDQFNFSNSGVCKITFDEDERSVETSFKKKKEKIFFDHDDTEVAFFSHKVSNK
jgi:hypothetical protein